MSSWLLQKVLVELSDLYLKKVEVSTTSYAVWNDVTGKAEEKLLPWPLLLVLVMFQDHFRKEVNSDLYGERGCLMGGIHGMFLAQYKS